MTDKQPLSAAGKRAKRKEIEREIERLKAQLAESEEIERAVQEGQAERERRLEQDRAEVERVRRVKNERMFEIRRAAEESDQLVDSGPGWLFQPPGEHGHGALRGEVEEMLKRSGGWFPPPPDQRF